MICLTQYLIMKYKLLINMIHQNKGMVRLAHPVVEDAVEEEYSEASQTVEDGKEVLVDNERLVDCQQTKHPGDA